jgi:hypothetical protein
MKFKSQKNREPEQLYCKLTQRMASYPYDLCCVCGTRYQDPNPRKLYPCSGPKLAAGPFRYPS